MKWAGYPREENFLNSIQKWMQPLLFQKLFVLSNRTKLIICWWQLQLVWHQPILCQTLKAPKSFKIIWFPPHCQFGLSNSCFVRVRCLLCITGLLDVTIACGFYPKIPTAVPVPHQNVLRYCQMFQGGVQNHYCLGSAVLNTKSELYRG